MIKRISDYIDIKYFISFLALFLFLKYFNLFFVGIVDPRGAIYSSFLDHYLNYTIPLRNSILYAAKAIVHIAGLQSYVTSAYLKLTTGKGIFLAFPCLGLTNLSFWSAFVLTQSVSNRTKIIWMLTGFLSIWVINCFRIAFLLIAINKKLNVNSIAEHHDLYNYVSYVLIAVMIYAFTKSVKKEERSLAVKKADTSFA